MTGKLLQKGTNAWKLLSEMLRPNEKSDEHISKEVITDDNEIELQAI
jgi:hypothetical protein